MQHKHKNNVLNIIFTNDIYDLELSQADIYPRQGRVTGIVHTTCIQKVRFLNTSKYISDREIFHI